MNGITILPAFALVPLLAAPAAGQELVRRVAASPDGEVRMHYAAREGVCSWDGQVRRAGDELEFCARGPVRVALTVRGGRVVEMRTRVGSEWSGGGGGATELGRVGASAAAAFLIGLAEGSPSGPVGSRAVFAAVVADSARVEPDLARIARAEVPRATRRAARFWLAQQAADASAPVGGAGDPVSTQSLVDNEEAVYALVRRPRREGVPELIRLAREDADPYLRRSALFWLGQLDDPRALALFEELLGR
jgi:hypothetical protein